MNSYVTGSVIKSLREEQKLTQAALAKMLDVSDKTVSKWETGKGYPDITLIEPIAKALGVSVTELLSGETVKNSNRSCNMKKSVFYVCPACGNVITSTGEAVVCCHGITIPPAEAEAPDKAHGISVEKVEDEYCVSVCHEMTKTHYISFIAAVSDNGISLVKLYPEGEALARFKINRTELIFCYCNRHGLFSVKPPEINKDYSKEAREKWQNTAAFKEFESRKKSEKDTLVSADGLMWIFAKFGKIKDLSPVSEEAVKLVKELKNYITENYYNCTDGILSGLGEMYVNDARFKEKIDSVGGNGTAEFVSKAIKNITEHK